MSVESPVQTNHGTIGFRRVVQVRQYESCEASIHIDFDVDPNNINQTMANAKAAMFNAKAFIFEELGLELTVDEGGVVREVLTKQFGKVTEVTPTAAPAVASPPPVVAAAAVEVTAAPPAAPALSLDPPFSPSTTNRDEKAANKKWALADIKANPGDWFDNRENKKSDRSPDFKHKTNGIAVWMS
jgi:hypothetical protein